MIKKLLKCVQYKANCPLNWKTESLFVDQSNWNAFD